MLTFICALNPMGLISALANIGGCLAIAGWVLAVCFFVHHSGGV